MATAKTKIGNSNISASFSLFSGRCCDSVLCHLHSRHDFGKKVLSIFFAKIIAAILSVFLEKAILSQFLWVPLRVI